MSVIRTPALILRHRTDREADRSLVVLTPTHGQLPLKARGTKKGVSKLGGSLEPLTEVDLMLANGRAVDVVTGSVIRQRFSRLRADLTSFVMAQWLLELVERVTTRDHASPGLYELVLEALTALEAGVDESAGRRWLDLYRWGWRLLVHEGFVPAPDQCVVCHQPLGDEDCRWQPGHGFVHEREAKDMGQRIAADVLAYMRGGNWPTDLRRGWQQVHQLIEAVIHHTLERPLQSERVLRSVMRLDRLSGGEKTATMANTARSTGG